ncbi:uncharacterized protein BDZ99DRAFT_475080 [Mytilinidion resinicola]|uniref:Uncharacterized protein n=1 Tax=Mytilinidion resinicola TaxID=574789 RepID=A0A6A6YU95_9PEZI|nr:uncharacterized protein BDZ99DRAFT_475080 [Mytilinidion resinicola]KAF2811535.1 hypothetical protein BDZ99DRAFT_475080 [Mytilinidion resinicola]
MAEIRRSSRAHVPSARWLSQHPEWSSYPSPLPTPPVDPQAPKRLRPLEEVLAEDSQLPQDLEIQPSQDTQSSILIQLTQGDALGSSREQDYHEMASPVDNTMGVTVPRETVAATEMSTLTSRDSTAPTTLDVISLRPATIPATAPNFKGIEMNDPRLNYLTKPIATATERLTGWIWRYGVPLESRDREVVSRYWLCTRCYRDYLGVKLYKVIRGPAAVGYARGAWR